MTGLYICRVKIQRGRKGHGSKDKASWHIVWCRLPWPCCMSSLCGQQRRFNEKTGNCTLILYKTNGQRTFPQCVLRTLSIVHLRRLFTLILPSICCFVSLLIHRAIHTSLWTSHKPQLITSKARDQLQVHAHWWRDERTSSSHCLMGNMALPIFYLHKIILIFQKSHSLNGFP